MGLVEIYRYERKYLVSERTAESVRQFASCYLVPDEHMAGHDAAGYRVCSLYLDTPDRALYRQSKDGVKNRYKLRIRFYDELDSTPAFLEIKRRATDTVHKLRATVSKATANLLLHGRPLDHADLLTRGDASQRALEDFCQACQRLTARGIVFVDYQRAAYVSQSAESVRVTFDRQVVGRPYFRESGLRPPNDETPPVTQGVVLELKYNGRAPRWMHDLVTAFSLQRLSFPKYVRCADALQVHSQYTPKLVRS